MSDHTLSVQNILRAMGLSAQLCADIAARAAALGVGEERVAIAWGLVDEDHFYAMLARLLGIGFVKKPFTIDRASIAIHGAKAGITRSAKGQVIAAPQGEALSAFLADRPQGCLLTSPRLLRASLRDAFRTVDGLLASGELPLLSPGETAWRDGSASGFIVAAFFLALVALAFREPLYAWPVTVPLSLLFIWTIGQRLMAVMQYRQARVISPEPSLPPLALPTYSILVPLYREDRILGRLIGALDALDYPAEKLEIFLLVEEDDEITRVALARYRLPPYFSIIPCPPGSPRTKPRALNIGLRECTGDYVVVYDAEDRPEPDQLRKAAALFRSSPSDLACVQAEIAIEDGDNNFFTRGFALEYAALFQIIVPSLCALGLPVALGGTSNHFRRPVLLDLHGWDAWNVTEDADLGLRLALHGYRVAYVASRTWEEAPDKAQAWRQQRVRWIKGWMQTSLVHLRAMQKHWRHLSFATKIGLLHHLIGTPVSVLLTPLFLIDLLATYVTGCANVLATGFVALGTALTLSAIGMMVALYRAACPMLASSSRRQALIMMPFYLLMICGCAWLALAELVRAPFQWNKTPHGERRAPDTMAPASMRKPRAASQKPRLPKIPALASRKTGSQ